tara:strand:- start:367 stop:945 length:579 start_codon:yes stop_codon:yes gene_type:complete
MGKGPSKEKPRIERVVVFSKGRDGMDKLGGRNAGVFAPSAMAEEKSWGGVGRKYGNFMAVFRIARYAEYGTYSKCFDHQTCFKSDLETPSTTIGKGKFVQPPNSGKEHTWLAFPKEAEGKQFDVLCIELAIDITTTEGKAVYKYLGNDPFRLYTKAYWFSEKAVMDKVVEKAGGEEKRYQALPATSVKKPGE